MKVLTLYRNDVFHMETYYANQNELPSGASARISSYTVIVSIKLSTIYINQQFLKRGRDGWRFIILTLNFLVLVHLPAFCGVDMENDY